MAQPACFSTSHTCLPIWRKMGKLLGMSPDFSCRKAPLSPHSSSLPGRWCWAQCWAVSQTDLLSAVGAFRHGVGIGFHGERGCSQLWMGSHHPTLHCFGSPVEAPRTGPAQRLPQAVIKSDPVPAALLSILTGRLPRMCCGAQEGTRPGPLFPTQS